MDPRKAEEEARKAEEEAKRAAAEAARKAEEQRKADAKEAPLPNKPIEALRDDRPERRKKSVERLRRRWGRILGQKAGAEELKTHVRRVAMLQRIRAVADANKDRKTVESCDELLTKEDDRHSKAMNDIREANP